MTKEKKFEELTPEELKGIKIEFAPGCFDNFEGTQEELDEMIAEIRRMLDTGEFVEHSRPLTEEEFNELPEEVQEKVAGFLDSDDETIDKRNLH